MMGYAARLHALRSPSDLQPRFPRIFNPNMIGSSSACARRTGPAAFLRRRRHFTYDWRGAAYATMSGGNSATPGLCLHFTLI